MMIDSGAKETEQFLVEQSSDSLTRFYYGEDLFGNEVGAASKNAIGITAGVLDSLSRAALRGTLTSHGTHGIVRLIETMGGDGISIYGLTHLGNYQAAVFSPYSHSRAFGECSAKGEHYGELAEGVVTTRAMLRLGEQYGVKLPICQTMEAITHDGQAADKVLSNLFLHSQKAKF